MPQQPFNRRHPAAQSGPVAEPSANFDYVNLFEYAPVGYMLLNDSGRIAKINRTGASLLGWDPSWLEGKPFSRWVANSDKQLFAEHQRRLAACDDDVTQELRVKNRQGRIATVQLTSVRAVAGPDGARCYRSIMVDVSGEQRSAREISRLRSQLTHATRLNTAGELASRLAHELNQPLGTVVLNCEGALRILNERGGDDTELTEVLQQARAAAAFASEVVHHLRGFLSNGGELRTVCDLSELIQHVATLIRADARDDDVELQLDVPRDLPDVHVDCVQIEQVLLNLAHNSIEAMREREGGLKRVVISARQRGGDRITVSVADTGPGLDANQFKRMFSPFYTTKRDGMGLGLTISRSIIEAHGGELRAVPEARHGATLQFTLPAFAMGAA